VNHSYDNEIDNDKRIRMIVDEIIRLNNKKDLIREFFEKNEDRFIKNQEKVRNIKDMEFAKSYYLNLINF
jgi:hypothetical protein